MRARLCAAVGIHKTEWAKLPSQKATRTRFRTPPLFCLFPRQTVVLPDLSVPSPNLSPVCAPPLPICLPFLWIVFLVASCAPALLSVCCLVGLARISVCLCAGVCLSVCPSVFVWVAVSWPEVCLSVAASLGCLSACLARFSFVVVWPCVFRICLPTQPNQVAFLFVWQP